MSKGKIIGLIIAIVVLVGTTISVLLLLSTGSDNESDDSSEAKKPKATTISTTSQTSIETTAGSTETTAGATETTPTTSESTPSNIPTGNDKIFSKSGLSITLTDNFVEKSLLTQTAYYESSTAIVTTLKEPFENLESIGLNKDSSLRDYAQAVINTNGFNNQGTYVQEGNGFTGFEYSASNTGVTINYIAVVYKTNDSFWLVQFACQEEDSAAFAEVFDKWAKSVVFN